MSAKREYLPVRFQNTGAISGIRHSNEETTRRKEKRVRAMRLPAFSVSASLHSSAATWVLLQQVLMRGLVAVKFLAIGRILGPEAIGSVSVALLAVAIAESLS